MTSIFLSSVMTGMEDMRSAAEAACDSIDITVVKAEDFTAQSGSPRGACLQGVADADGVVLLVGAKHGSALPSSKSATEEEFDEAVRLRKDVFVFRTADDIEPNQRAFLDRIGQWNGGHFYKTCLSATDLQRDIVKALMAWSSAPSATEIDSAVRDNLDRVTPATQRGMISQRGPWLSLSWSPCQRLRLDDDFVFESLPDIIADRLVAGPSRLLNTRPEFGPEEHGLSVRSRHSESPELRAWIAVDGSVALGAEVESRAEDAGRGFLTASLFLSPADLSFAMGRMLAFAGLVLEESDPDRRCTSGRMQVSLSQMGMRNFGEPPQHHGAVQLGMPGDLDRSQPITVPSEPLVVVRSQLVDNSPEVSTFVKKLERIARGRSG